MQAKIAIGPPNDHFEQEADRFADAIVARENRPFAEQAVDQSVTPFLQRRPIKPAESVGEDAIVDGSVESFDELRACRRGANALSDAPASFSNRLQRAQSGGEPLPSEVRTPMEFAFRARFSEVRVHSDAESAELSKEIGAFAFTHGTHIFLGANQFDTSSQHGRRLLAHELTHVIQQNPRVMLSQQARQQAPGKVVQRDTMPDTGIAGGPEKTATIIFYGINHKVLHSSVITPLGSLGTLEPDDYECELTGSNRRYTLTLGSQDYPLSYTPQLEADDLDDARSKAQRVVLRVQDKHQHQVGPAKTDPGGSKFGIFGLFKLPKWAVDALEAINKALGNDEELQDIRSLIVLLMSLYDNRAQLASLTTVEDLLNVLFGITDNAAVDALERWSLRGSAQKITHAAKRSAKKGLAALVARLMKILEVVRNVLKPIFAVRNAFKQFVRWGSEILDNIPLIADILDSSREDRKELDFDDLVTEAATELTGAVGAKLQNLANILARFVSPEHLADSFYIKSEELARAIADVAKQFLPKYGKLAVKLADLLPGVDVTAEIADNFLAPLIPKGALDTINNTIRDFLHRLDPFFQPARAWIGKMLQEVLEYIHTNTEPWLRSVVAQLSPLASSASRGNGVDALSEQELSASSSTRLPHHLLRGLKTETGFDFSTVRVHVDANSIHAADAVGAKAFTVGNDVFFGSAQYAPETQSGRRLIAHELAHTIQQSKGLSNKIVQRATPKTIDDEGAKLKALILHKQTFSSPSPEIEQEAKAITDYVEKKLDKTKISSESLPVLPRGYSYVFVGGPIPTRIRRARRYRDHIPKLRIVERDGNSYIEKGEEGWKAFKKRSRNILSARLNCKDGQEAHHVIPLALYPLEAVQQAVSAFQFDINSEENGVCLEKAIHGEKGHPNYSMEVRQDLEALAPSRGISVKEFRSEFKKLIRRLKAYLNSRTSPLTYNVSHPTTDSMQDHYDSSGLA